ncbi:MAG: di-trans,poly-cis-decaprenylcistransferase [Phycisphaerae bacterium]|nr:di-trans,poly-cis-decaprenylcistransferase [Phycisphaerae bacterium]
MDGNGRWAEARGRPRIDGHRAGAKAVQGTVEAAAECGVEVLTLYSFSTENWSRPQAEVTALMTLFESYMTSERDRLMEQGIRYRRLGQREGLPAAVLDRSDRLEADTAPGSSMTLQIAINYGSRQEITNAARRLALDVAMGRLNPDEISEDSLSERLLTANVPDPDLVIRTGGEARLSNFLLWQSSYAELVVQNELWPDFDAEALHRALHEYEQRPRRLGGTTSS